MLFNTSNNKAILISDAHVKSRLWTNFPSIQGDAYRALQIVADAASDKVVISCGDFFDSNRPSSKDLEAAAGLIRRSSEFLYVQGNHDDCTPSIVDSLDGTHIHLNSNGYAIGNTCIFGVDYQNTKDKVITELRNIAEQIEAQGLSAYERVIIMHQSLKEFFNMGSLEAADIYAAVGDDVKVFIGDIHSYGLVQHGDGFVMSPGPLVPQDLNQARRAQSYYVLDLDRFGVESVPIKVRDYYFLDATQDGFDLTRALQQAMEEADPVNTPLAKAVIMKAYPGFKVPKDMLSDDKVFVVDTVRKREEKKQRGPELTLMEAVDAEIDATEGAAAKTMKMISRHLMAAEDPDELAAKWFKQWEVITNGTQSPKS